MCEAIETYIYREICGGYFPVSSHERFLFGKIPYAKSGGEKAK